MTLLSKSSTPSILSRIAAKKLQEIERQRKGLDLDIPPWAKPLRHNTRYKAAYGGRSGGKSHYFAEAIVERMVQDPDLRVVCIREIQKSLKFSAMALIKRKIKDLDVTDMFEVLTTEIRRKDGDGVIIFQGMQDHTADSIKSLEGFGIAWVEEAQNLSDRSLRLLRPTIRTPGSELWFSWNPDQPTDAVDNFFRNPEKGPPPNAIVVNVNYDQNPRLPAESLAEMELDRDRDSDYFQHVWLGAYNVHSQLQVLGGKYRADEFIPGPDWDGPYFGADWGFGSHPTAAVKLWIYDNCLWVERESWALNLELDEVGDRWCQDIPGIDAYVVRADNSQPQSINHVKKPKPGRSAIPKLEAAPKWPGSIKDGINYLRSFREIVVHQRCKKYLEECRLYRYKTNGAGDPLPDVEDANNHLIDSTRYGLSPLIQVEQKPDVSEYLRRMAG